MRQSGRPVIDTQQLRYTYPPAVVSDLSKRRKYSGMDATRMESDKKSTVFDPSAFLNEVKSAFARLSTDKNLSPSEKVNLLEAARVALDSEKYAIERQHVPQLPNPSDNYPRYPGHGEDALKWLETHWGRYLKNFGADKDYLYQDQLRKLDPKLISTLKTMRYRASIDNSGKKLRDIIPIKSDRLTERINTLLCKDLKDEVVGAYLLSHKRKSRKSTLGTLP